MYYFHRSSWYASLDSVRQYRHCSLAYFSAWITPNHLATCLASGHSLPRLIGDPSAYGTSRLNEFIRTGHPLERPTSWTIFTIQGTHSTYHPWGVIWKRNFGGFWKVRQVKYEFRNRSWLGGDGNWKSIKPPQMIARRSHPLTASSKFHIFTAWRLNNVSWN